MNMTRLAAFGLFATLTVQGRFAEPAPFLPVASPAQMRWHRAEYILFAHFGMKTFYPSDDHMGYGCVAVPPVITSQAMLPSGSFQLTFTGPPGQSFSVRGTNLVEAPLSTWPVLTNGAISADGAATFTDPEAGAISQRF